MPAHAPLVPAQLAFAANGTPYSAQFDDIYHSSDGGLGQARHVFLAGNDLPRRWQGQPRFTILETGFGLGLNFLATWAAWREDPQRAARLDFISVEKHPFGAADLAALHRRWPEFAELSATLLAQWPVLVPGFHRLYLDNGTVCLTLLLGDAQHMLRQLLAQVDAIYLDGFAPDKNPELWCAPVFKALARLAKPGATLATYTVAAAVRDGLDRVGFRTEKRPGFGRKREMLAGRFAQTHPSPSHRGRGENKAIVIGGGLAGCAVSERLAARGWQVSLIERHAAPAQEASGNLAGIVRPMLSLDDNIASRLSRACFLFALNHWRTLQAEGLPLKWFPQGVLQLARDPAHEALQREIIAARRFPSEFVRWLDAAEAGALIDWPVPLGAWLFPQGGHANPPSLCRAYLARFPDRIERHFAQEALSLEHGETGWRVLDEHGQALARAETVVLASGAEARRFGQSQHLPIRRIRGQVSHIAEGTLPSLPMALTREGYATPALDGWHCAGASYELEENPALCATSSEGNLLRLEQMLPGSTQGMDAAGLDGRVALRAVAPDRLPLAGALPDPTAQLDPHRARLADLPRLPGLYALLGLGSRGLVWHALAAERIAAQIAGDPLPLEKDLLDAIDPARFLLRARRRGKA
ncbi:tRNA 5-methylaminomethyl-2-thiouridine biosynthesis bifunctional protein [Sulfuritortus calidifontis]|uniref:tRNA 5-methylaminomethyl-2-thiouridine biosynthesis bifunctional protein MnmC n=1 Tax=Sulfuritortus calidifontis TaxID=1914471 RepID=A0A4R3JWR5_9PROT|nr:bifunctional tRNA (5-methylaminomethyl-2-thiouridine)(34)-methyltransferase MnmD/FAD-dependent 5-carboxymethylaminomethyl-2-thiouridine(34) oxidoreductase MnmC [Sulfuritortus calidifontis]TCS72725.1 tRNA 5-methylaminomethyl-2-thiouridine biosynthesis bifunctional protein [Sulfuritortus calidifontis]